MTAISEPVTAAPPPTVRIADDNEDLRTLVRLCLGARGWTVREAVDGADAPAACRQKAPALLLLDVHMPRVDGWAVLAQLQAAPHLKQVPVIMLTTPEGPQEVAAGLDRGRPGLRGQTLLFSGAVRPGPRPPSESSACKRSSAVNTRS